MSNIEILSPVGRMDMLAPAVFSGANAIYIGFGGLSARRDVQDFSHEEKKYVIDFCHQRDVKVYLALNTILFDHELNHAATVIAQAATLGVDGIILQDMAVYSLVKSICKDIPLHGSTQMSVGSVFGAKALENLGFKRVVLSRELSYDEIKSIRVNTNLELEIFVHGAHCMSVSGQCYMSSFIGARSGNRGMCAQPCRLPFSKDEKNKNEYALSLKDLSIIKHMDKLKELGINSLKIEGRMKRPEYVAAATTAVKAYIENTAGKKQSMKDLEMVFSRSGFSDGFFTSNIDENMYGTRGKKDVINSQKILKKIGNSYHKEPQQIKLNFSYTQQENMPISLTVSDNNALNGKVNSATVFGAIPEKALNKPTTKELALKNLGKLGNTPFYIDDGDVKWDINETLMIRASEINNLRRSAIEELEKKRLEGFSKNISNNIKLNLSEKTKKQTSPPKIRIRISNVQNMPKNFGIAEYIYIPVNILYENITLVDNIKEKIIIETPRANFGHDKTLMERLTYLKENGINNLEINNVGHVKMAKELGFNMHGGFGLNIFNSLSIEEYKNLGLKDTTLSIESSLKNIRKLDFTKMQLGAVIHGYLPVMITRNCPGKAVSDCKTCSKSLKMYDRLGNEFLVSCKNSYKKQYSEIYNPHVLFMRDRLLEIGFLDFHILYFTDEDKKTIEDVIDSYYKNIENISFDKITRGLFYKEII